MEVMADQVGFPSNDHGFKVVQVAEHVTAAIQSGRLVPGQRLVEADFTRDLGISRSLLREVFRMLHARGVIEIVPNRGALVRRLSLREAEDLFQVRMELEALAARLAAGNCRAPDVRAQFESQTAEILLDHARLSTSEYLSENQRFHEAIFETAGNLELRKLNQPLQLSLMMAQIGTLLSPDVMSASISEHRSIASAILAGDVMQADTAARAHLSRARELVRSMPENVFRRE
jgi:DNA-binding GntR family transcriptional regulator